MRFGVFLSAAVLSGVASAGVGKMDAKPIWDLADHGGPRPISSAATLEVPNSAIPNVSSFTIEATLKFGEMPLDHGFTIFDQTVSETGWGLWFTTVRSCAKPLMLKINGESYTCSFAFMKVEPGSTHTFTVTARKGWIVTYKDAVPQKSFMMSVTPNLAPITVGGPRPGYPKAELEGIELVGLKVWGDEEEYWGVGEAKKPTLGYKAGKGWLVNVPVEPMKDKPNVFYYGDSISVGYTQPLTKLLKGKANLYHWMWFLSQPGEKGVGEKRFEEVCKLADYDCVVFNNGLHSLHWTEDKVSDEEIRASYRGLARTLRKNAPKAKLVYLMTTPHTAKADAQGKVNGFGEKNGVVLRLNRIAAEVMKEEGIPVIDAYRMLSDKTDLARGDQYHWKPPAYEMLAESVVNAFGL